MKTVTEMSEPKMWDFSGLCGTTLTGCRQRAEYAVFLLEGGSTVRRVLGYVDPLECTRKIPCDWTSGWKHWKSKESRKKMNPKTFFQSDGEKMDLSGRNKETCQLDGWSEESRKSSGIFQIMDELLAKDILEDLVVEGKSCEKMLT